MGQVTIPQKPAKAIPDLSDKFALWENAQKYTTTQGIINRAMDFFYTKTESDEMFNPGSSAYFADYDDGFTYIAGTTYYVSYAGYIYKFIEPDDDQLGKNPVDYPEYWDQMGVGEFAHERDKDDYLAYGEAEQVSAVELRAFMDSKAVALGLASLDAAGTIPIAQMPPIAVVDYLGDVADQAAMLGLSGEKGDWCIRNDDSKVYIIIGADPSQASDWQALSYPTGLGGSGLANRVTYWNSNSVLTYSVTTAAELGHVSGVTSAIQTQLNAKANLSGATFTGAISAISYKLNGTEIISAPGVLSGVTGSNSMWTNDQGYLKTADLNLQDVTDGGNTTNNAVYINNNLDADTYSIDATMIITNAKVLQNVTGNISMFTNDAGYLTSASQTLQVVTDNDSSLTTAILSTANGNDFGSTDFFGTMKVRDNINIGFGNSSDVKARYVTATDELIFDTTLTSTDFVWQQNSIDIMRLDSSGLTVEGFVESSDGIFRLNDADFYDIQGSEHRWFTNGAEVMTLDDTNGGTLFIGSLDGIDSSLQVRTDMQWRDNRDIIMGSGGDVVIQYDSGSDILSQNAVSTSTDFSWQHAGAESMRLEDADGGTLFIGALDGIDSIIEILTVMKISDNLEFRFGTSNDAQIDYNSVGDVFVFGTTSTTTDFSWTHAGVESMRLEDADGGTLFIGSLDGIDSVLEVLTHVEFQDSKHVRLGNSGDCRIYFDGSNTYFDNINADQFRWKINGNQRMQLQSDGDLLVYGNVGADESAALSDRNWKKNIKTIFDSGRVFDSIRGVTYDWKHKKGSGAGAVAQEIASVLPWAVKEYESLDSGKRLSLNYNVLWGYAIEEIKDLRKRISKLEQTNPA
jgi:hypothetical protein